MNFAKTIRDRRIQLGLDASTVAKRAGLSVHEYGDVEQHADEFQTAIALGTARQLSKVLGLSLRELMGLPKETSTTPQTHPIPEMIRTARKRQGLSEGQLGDRIGFDEETVRSLESDPDFVDTLPFAVLRDLEDALGIQKGSLIRE